MLTTNNHDDIDNASRKVEDWIFSLIIAGVAFTFYIVFILEAGLNSTNAFIIYGGSACFIIVELYWVIHGVKHHSNSVVTLGVIGIAIALGILHLYINL